MTHTTFRTTKAIADLGLATARRSPILHGVRHKVTAAEVKAVVKKKVDRAANKQRRKQKHKK